MLRSSGWAAMISSAITCAWILAAGGVQFFAFSAANEGSARQRTAAISFMFPPWRWTVGACAEGNLTQFGKFIQRMTRHVLRGVEFPADRRGLYRPQGGTCREGAGSRGRASPRRVHPEIADRAAAHRDLGPDVRGSVRRAGRDPLRRGRARPDA